MTYANCILYGATLPNYRKNKYKGKNGDKEVIVADDPKNRQRISEIIAAMK